MESSKAPEKEESKKDVKQLVEAGKTLTAEESI